jgi:Lon protease-like protein
LEELEDGRMVIEVDTNFRLRLHNEIQILPFNIWVCEELPDQSLTEQSTFILEQTQQKILQRLIVMTHNYPEFQEALKSDYWRQMASDTFSFAVMGLLGMHADLKQELLEMRRPTDRLEQILAILNTG